jgi:hypothetical protein
MFDFAEFLFIPHCCDQRAGSALARDADAVLA